MPNNTYTPINRNNIFYSEREYDYETDLLMDYIEGDLNQTVVVYPVDREKTQVNAITRMRQTVFVSRILLKYLANMR